MSQHLCLLCCYSFQEKRSRFISDEALGSFRKFCGELGICLSPKDDSGCGSKKQKKSSKGLGLDLPYGENITVCGDCLSLVVLYVQRRNVQTGMEKKLLELQKAVCTALKDLKEVIDDVQGHIDQLHSTVRLGDETSLNTFCKDLSSKDEENNPWVFRAKVLKLNTGIIKVAKKASAPDKYVQDVPINIKLEPRDLEEDYNDGNFNPDSFDVGGDSFYHDDNDANISNPEDDTPGDTATALEIPGIERYPPVGKMPTSRRGRRRVLRTARKRTYNERSLMGDDHFKDFDNQDYAHSPPQESNSEDDIDDAASDFSEPKVKVKRFRGKKKVKGKEAKRPRLKRFKKKTDIKDASSNPEGAVDEDSHQSGEQWKDDLIGRIVMQMNNDINIHEDEEPIPSEETGDGGGQPGGSDTVLKMEDQIGGLNLNSFQLVDGELKLRGVIVKIRENHRALQCARCGKKYFEERDVTNEEIQLEALMRDHILSKHCVKSTKKSLQEMEVLAYTSTTRNKITYKLACAHKYSYTRRATNFKSGAQYFRCDYRIENCGATILYKDGVYRKMIRGWNPDGTHAIHEPDIERTNKQIEVGRAKAMFLSNTTKSIDDVCDDILNQSNGQLMTPMERLKRRMLYAKYKTTGMPQEERAKRTYPCPHCNLVYKEKRGLSRHIKTRHEQGGSGGSSQASPSGRRSISPRKSGSGSSSPRLKKIRVPKKDIKRDVVEEEEEAEPDLEHPPLSSLPPTAAGDGPSIVFNDPTVASNFVNKCISAIMQQVGISVSGSNVSPVRPPNAPIPSEIPPRESIASSSVSPAPSDNSQHESIPIVPPPSNQAQAPHHHSHGNVRGGNHSYVGGHHSTHWQQPAPPGGLQGQFSSNPNSNQQTNTNPMHGWPWNVH